MESNTFYTRDKCRICDSNDLAEVLNLGSQPPANAFLTPSELEKPESTYQLRVHVCRRCSLVQLLDVVDPEKLFRNYRYATSASSPLVRHFEDLADLIRKTFIRSKNDLVVDIGGNDGSFLALIVPHARVLNIEPSENVAKLSVENNVPVESAFFSKAVAEEIIAREGHATVVTASNVCAHIDDVHDLFRGIKTLIGENGVFIGEVHWVGNLIGEGGFDQVYHEHLSYYSLHALVELCRRAGLTIFDVETVPVHGESLRIFAAARREPEENVTSFLRREKELGLHQAETYLFLTKSAERVKTGLRDLIGKLKKERNVIAGYGAPAKGNTLLNYSGLGAAEISYIVDSTPFKQGLYTPGTHIQIYPEEHLLEDKPDYILLLAWNYASAILEKNKTLRQEGVRFIIPTGDVSVV